MSIYLKLTEKFNAGRVRVVICSGQATVLHRLALMSKDGDWIIRDDQEAFAHVLSVLAEFKAKYRLGAPLDRRWLAAGWSSHFEFFLDGLRVRADFFSRPPRIEAAELARIWQNADKQAIPVVDLVSLAQQKKTMREKDYPIIGALAEQMTDLYQKLMYDRDPKSIIKLRLSHPDIFQKAATIRPLLLVADQGREALENVLDQERRAYMRDDEKRLITYAEAGAPWLAQWSQLSRKIENLDLQAAHNQVVKAAEDLLPTNVI